VNRFVYYLSHPQRYLNRKNMTIKNWAARRLVRLALHWMSAEDFRGFIQLVAIGTLDPEMRSWLEKARADITMK